MRSLVLLAMIGVVIAVVIWGVQRLRSMSGPGLPRGFAGAPGAAIEGDIVERCSLAYGPDRGTGALTLTPSQLIFTADSGRVRAVERLDIVGATTTTDLPDRSLARPVLAVTSTEDTWYFAVADPGAWLRRLT